MNRSELTHLSLLLRLRDRTDQRSWREFHERYGELLYRYARGRGASRPDAEDVVQDVELYLVKAMPGFEYNAHKGRFRAYLRSAVSHVLARRANREARQAPALDPQNFDQVAGIESASSDARWEHEWQLHRLRWALRSIADQFDPSTVKAFELYVLAGRPVEETAEATGLSKASVYQARCRMLRALRERLAGADRDGGP
jgi:RNA polymerase sigma factor (sigma-70 family)